jgi:hypothetical protein
MTETHRKQLDAIDLLMQDHRELESMFRHFEYLHARDEDAGEVVEAACAEIRTHDAVKSELFCPAVSEAIDEPDMEDLLAQIEEGHQAIRKLVSSVEQAARDDAKRNAQFSLLTERVEQQFELAETRVFPRARRAERLDLAAVTDRMKARRSEMARHL